MAAVHAFQIFYNEATRAAVDPAFIPLDNSGNERPDWYEYWPIRRWLKAHPQLDESALYGFFSPLFHEKTRLAGREVVAFASAAGAADVVTFSPHPDHGALFYNLFEQGANFFPGFLDAARPFVQQLDPDIRLEHVCNDARNVVFSNYFLARPRFWREWLRAVDLAFAQCEPPASPLGALLNREVAYSKDDGDTKPAQLKIMVLERIPSLMLAVGTWEVRSHDPFGKPPTDTFAPWAHELRELDRLKAHYSDTGDEASLREFVRRRDPILAEARARARR
jgi:hypothetical protein